jgi:transposase
MSLSYRSDLTDEQWEVIKTLIPPIVETVLRSEDWHNLKLFRHPLSSLN